jgi:hypothetical protein
VRASDEDVDLYVDRASHEALVCRERGRHVVSTVCEVGVYVSGVDADGLFIRRLTRAWCELRGDGGEVGACAAAR